MEIRDPWRDLVVEPVSREHFVQVYRDERALHTHFIPVEGCA